MKSIDAAATYLNIGPHPIYSGKTNFVVSINNGFITMSNNVIYGIENFYHHWELIDKKKIKTCIWK